VPTVAAAVPGSSPLAVPSLAPTSSSAIGRAAVTNEALYMGLLAALIPLGLVVAKLYSLYSGRKRELSAQLYRNKDLERESDLRSSEDVNPMSALRESDEHRGSVQYMENPMAKSRRSSNKEAAADDTPSTDLGEIDIESGGRSSSYMSAIRLRAAAEAAAED
jgi:hypothetical protein